jgi:hypothetical protein
MVLTDMTPMNPGNCERCCSRCNLNIAPRSTVTNVEAPVRAAA